MKFYLINLHTPNTGKDQDKGVIMLAHDDADALDEVDRLQAREVEESEEYDYFDPVQVTLITPEGYDCPRKLRKEWSSHNIVN